MKRPTSSDLAYAALVASVLLAGLGPVDGPTPQPDPASPSQAVSSEPYGGCDEAGRYPETEGAQWCAARDARRVLVARINRQEINR